jgi:predicted nuclease of predicted toxin-antitoxin system
VKLLFDENLSPKLPRRLAELFPDSSHVRDVNLKSADDPVVWQYAKDNDFTIVSKDSDLHQRSFVLGHPPKLIWIRLGNCSTRDVEELLRHNFLLVTNFNADSDASFLVLY